PGSACSSQGRFAIHLTTTHETRPRKQDLEIMMIGITPRGKWRSAAATILVAGIAGAFLGSPARADTVDVYIDNVDNHAVTLTATDKNSGQSLVSGKTLQHNERWSGKMLLDKDNNGHVYFEATGVNAPNCESELTTPSSSRGELRCRSAS